MHDRQRISPWPIADLVRAQRMACGGASADAIAEALGRPVHDVRCRLDPEPAVPREEFAHVGHAHLKRRPVESRRRRGRR
jgi:hypothetical protein